MSLLFPLCYACLGSIFPAHTHILTPLLSNKEAGRQLIDIVIKSGLNSGASAYIESIMNEHHTIQGML